MESATNAKEPLWEKHFSLIIALLVSSLTIFLLLSFSKWDLTTALAIFQKADLGKMLLGSIISVLPILSGLLVLVGVYLIILAKQRTDVERSAIWMTVAFIAFVSYAITPILMYIVIAILTGILFLTSFFLSKKAGNFEKTSSAPSKFETKWAIAGFVLLSLWYLFGFSGPSWLPMENIILDKKDSISGFIISEENDVVYYINSKKIGLAEIDANKIEHSLCSPDIPFWNKAPQNLLDPLAYEPCV